MSIRLPGRSPISSRIALGMTTRPALSMVVIMPSSAPITMAWTVAVLMVGVMRCLTGAMARTSPAAPRRVGDVPAIVRLAVGLVVGTGVGILPRWDSGVGGALAAWAAAAVIYCGWTLAVLLPMDADRTAAHATREEPTRVGEHVVVATAGLASLVGVGVVLLDRAHAQTVGSSLVAVVASWLTVHTSAMARYARLYYTPPVGGVDFHQSDPPRYSDFAYMAFTVGMSFAISDTDLASSRMRREALLHALQAYVFGTVIVALLVNLVASIGG